MTQLFRFLAIVLLASSVFSQEPDSGTADSPDIPAFKNAAQRHRFRRLRLLGDVSVDWHCAVTAATPEQSGRLSRAMRETAGELAVRNSIRSSDFSLLTFVGERSDAGRVLIEGRPWQRGASSWESHAKAVLNDDQNSALQKALEERTAFQTQHATDALLGCIEESVGLSKDDRTRLNDRIRKVYGDKLLLRPVHTGNLRQLHLLDDAIIRDTLADRAASLARKMSGKADTSFMEATVVVDSDATDEEKQAAVSLACEPAAASFKRESTAAILMIVRRHDLDAKQSRRLRTAATGVRVRLVARWKEQVQEALGREPPVGLPGDLGLMTTPSVVLTVPELRDQPLWVSTLRKVFSKKNAEQVVRAEADFVRRGLVSRMVVALDQELWLRPDQREQFIKVVSSSVVDPTSPDNVASTERFLVRLVQSIPDDAVDEILTSNQKSVLELLRKPFVRF